MKYIVIILLLFLLGCSESPEPINKISQKEIEEILIQANKNAIRKETIQIEAYVKRRGLDVVQTGTGLRYQIYEDGEGKMAEFGKSAVVNYDVNLLNGTLCYSTKEKGPEEFVIGNDNVETGLHEAISYLKVGDKAIVIIPSHLAHGLAGDFDKIPVRSTIIYDLELIAVK